MTHTVLDVASFIPAVGTAASLINAGIYTAEGRYGEAAASAVTAIPGFGTAFAAGKVCMKLATAAPKVMKAVNVATKLAPMVPGLVSAGQDVAKGDYSKAALTVGSSLLPSVGGKLGQKLLGKGLESGSKVQAFAGKVLSGASGAAPNAIGASEVAKTYDAYKKGEASPLDVFKSGVYAVMPFVGGRMGGKKPPAGTHHEQTPYDAPHATPVSKGAEHNASGAKKVQPDTEHHASAVKKAPTDTHPQTKPGHAESQSGVGGTKPQRKETLKETKLRQALPKSAQVPVQVNNDLHGNTVQVHYARDKKGRVTDIHIQAGPKATTRDIELHARTVKSMKRYSGMSFHAQKLQDKIHGWVNKNGMPPVGSKAWEAKLEIQKLPNVIDDRMAKLAKGDLTPQQRQKLEKEVTHLEHQLDGYKKDFKAMDKDPGKGFVAADGTPLSKKELNALKESGLTEAEINRQRELLGDMHLFRGTTEGFPGSPAVQRFNITPASVDPVVATIFGIQSKSKGNAVVAYGPMNGFGHDIIRQFKSEVQHICTTFKAHFRYY